MRTFQIIIVDGRGSTTYKIQQNGNDGITEAIKEAIDNRPYTATGIVSVTATILSTSS